jgi:hypothetical protein
VNTFVVIRVNGKDIVCHSPQSYESTVLAVESGIFPLIMLWDENDKEVKVNRSAIVYISETRP